MFDERKLAPINGYSATVGIKDWLLLDLLSLLNLIPIIGSIIYIILILVIGFGSTTALSLKNRILATLIWMAIWIVLGILIGIFFGGVLLTTLSTFSY